MIRAVVLDTGPLARISHPRANPEIVAWLEGLVESGIRVILPRLVDARKWNEI